MEKQIDRIAEMEDMRTFFDMSNHGCSISVDGDNCYEVTFLNDAEITYSNMSFWNTNGFKLVGFGINKDNQLTVTINVCDRRIVNGTVKQVLVIQ